MSYWTPRLAALTLSAALAAVLAGSAYPDAAEKPKPGWIFKYDPGPAELPAELERPPDYIGTILDFQLPVAGGEAGKLRLEDLREGEVRLAVPPGLKVYGASGPMRVRAAEPAAHVAVYGEKADQRFDATLIFLMPDEEWQQLLAAKEDAEAVEPPSVPGPAVQPQDPTGTTPEQADRRFDFRGVVKSVRNQGTELSVKVDDRTVLVTLDERAVVTRGASYIRAELIQPGWAVEVRARLWRGKNNCTAERVWAMPPPE